ncbi:DHH family phosphoesterase [Mycoplasma sp. ES3157-GEN-MYC]|uniref:Phosphoesterase n=1 Tax=Mycoplasma miroungigenitalium TaxID=754515 RepID=A0A6M4JCB2_9MOLU|nr:DHH family phosphoesterase [Mycoplasma miroungigenitalium]MBU4690603.1 DHH family phosphoesterase [Mycoplasma miroungigenitalium]MBU4691870.1 DHH family phosphoesterase [Mycoplasma miroungigenitalium]QJR43727.1 phosphoesterase [Mycoplasma miroungigenitalium]
MNLKRKLILYIMVAIMSIFLVIASFIMLWLDVAKVWSAIFTSLLILSSVLTGTFIVLSIKTFIANQSSIKSSYSKFVDEIMVHNQVGTIIYDMSGNIIQTSEFIRTRFGKHLVGLKLHKFFESIFVNFSEKQREYEFKHENSYYVASVFPLNNYVSIRDNSLEKRSMQIYSQEQAVVGELEIDNYWLYQSILSEEQLYNLNKSVITVLDNLVQTYNLIYRQYNTNGKFLLVTNKISLDKMIDAKFEFFDKLHQVLKTDNNNIVVSVSAGFAYGANEYQTKIDLAKSALLQAQGRGGDQVVVLSPYDHPIYFGSTTEILPSVDRTRIRNLTGLVEQRLLNPKLDKVIIYGHAVADLDAIGSAMGVLALCKTYGKQVYICSATQDSTTKKVLQQYWENIGDNFIKPQVANKISDENTIVFFVDNAHPTRTDNPEAIKNVKSENIFILDHHRMKLSIDFAPKENRVIATSASSASELVTEMLIFSKRKVDVDLITAQMLLNGICLDTLQFQKHATSKTFEAASWLETRGANSTVAANALKIDAETYAKVNKMLESLEEVKEGFFLAYADVPMSDDLISITAEEILRIDGRRASFVVARQEKGDKYKLSARGIDTNVQIICEGVGGGGGFAAAAAVSTDDLETFIDNIKQAIVSVK